MVYLPLWKILVSWDYYSQCMESHKIPWFQSPPSSLFSYQKILPYTYHPILSALLERNPAGTSHQQDLTAPPNPWTPLLKNSSFACPGCVMQRGITKYGGHFPVHGFRQSENILGVSNAATAQLDIHPISRSNKQLKHVKTTFLEISQQVSPSYPHNLAIWFSQLGFMMVKPLWYPHDAPFLS